MSTRAERGDGASLYADKVDLLKRLFGATEIRVESDAIVVGPHRYPVVDGVIVMTSEASAGSSAERTRYSFGEEWRRYRDILPEHQEEFAAYFDLVDPDSLRDAVVCDLGCGMGRWSTFLIERCRALVLVDFSDAIFVARENLSGAPNAIFFKADLTQLPFADDCCDFLFSLGVLHHLDTPCLTQVRGLRRLANRILVYLYYALDNRPWHYRALLHAVSTARKALSRVRHRGFRKTFSWLVARGVYRPLVAVGGVMERLGKGRLVPLYEYYRPLGTQRMEQDVYDRFFTPVEQRVTRKEILDLRDTFSEVRVSSRLPYWHFLCIR